MHLKFSEFKEYRSLEETYSRVDFNLTTEIKLSFSVRVSNDADILICNGMNYNNDLCYWIIIGGFGNTVSYIIKCKTGLALAGMPINADCNRVGASYEVNICISCSPALNLFFIMYVKTFL